MTGWIATHRKAMFGYAGAAVTILTVVASVEHWHYPWIGAVLGVAAAIGVHAVPNVPSASASVAIPPTPPPPARLT